MKTRTKTRPPTCERLQRRRRRSRRLSTWCKQSESQIRDQNGYQQANDEQQSAIFSFFRSIEIAHFQSRPSKVVLATAAASAPTQNTTSGHSGGSAGGGGGGNGGASSSGATTRSRDRDGGHRDLVALMRENAHVSDAWTVNETQTTSSGRDKQRRAFAITVTSSTVARIIGRAGQNINAIRESTNAHIEVEKIATRREQATRQITVKGSVEAIRFVFFLFAARL